MIVLKQVHVFQNLVGNVNLIVVTASYFRYSYDMFPVKLSAWSYWKHFETSYC